MTWLGGFHRLSSVLEWYWGSALVLTGVMLSHPGPILGTAMQVPQAQHWVDDTSVHPVGAVGANPPPAARPADHTLSDWNGVIALIVLGLSLIGMKIVDLFLNFYERKKAIDNKSFEGQLKSCNATLEDERAKFKSEIARLQVSYQTEKERLEAAHKRVVAEFEERIRKKDEDVEYLERRMATLKEVIDDQNARLLALYAQLAQYGEKAINTANQITKIAQTSAETARSAVKRLPPPSDPDTDVDMPTIPDGVVVIQTPVDKVQITPAAPEPEVDGPSGETNREEVQGSEKRPDSAEHGRPDAEGLPNP